MTIRMLFGGTKRTTYQEKDGRPRKLDKRVRSGQFQRWKENQVGRVDKEDTRKGGLCSVSTHITDKRYSVNTN